MNITHIINLFRAYLIENKKRLLIGAFITFGIVVFGFTVTTESVAFLSFPYYALFFLTCFTIFGFKNNRTQFFILPSTTAEKFIYAMVTIVIMGIVFYLLSLAGAYIGHYLIRPLLYFGTSHYMFNEVNILNDSIWSWKSYLSFISTLSVFLFGSIYFKTNAFFKTLGVGIGFLFGIGFYFLALLYITFGNMMFSDNSININLTDYPFFQTHYYIFPILIIVFFLSLTYLRLRETEV